MDDNRNRHAPWTVAVGGLAFAGAVGVLVLIGGGRPVGADVPCRERVIAVHLSSSDRTPERRSFVIGLLEQALVSAAVCDERLDATGVAGGGTFVPLVTTDDADAIAPEGPNPTVRRSRFGADDEAEARALVTHRVDAALAEADGSTTTVAALYRRLAEHAGPETDAVLVTDGVNDDVELDLNRVLEAGEGARLADGVAVPEIGNRTTTIVGVAQVDAGTPVPGSTWPAEVRSFNERLCRRSAAGDCRLFSTASVTDALTT